MLTFHFSKGKPGEERLIDCLPFEAIMSYSNSLKDPHTTTFYELFIFTQVTGSINIDGVNFPLQGPCMLFLSPFTVRTWDVNCGSGSYVLFFSEEFSDSFLKDTAFLHRLHFFSYNQQSPVLPLKPETISDVQTQFKLIRGELELPRVDSRNWFQACWYQLLLRLNRLYGEYYHLSDRCYENTEIIRLKTLLKQHIHHKQTVADYAGMMGVNRNHLNNLCMRFYGENASLVIRKALIQVCKSELLLSQLTISEISYKYHFSAPSNFTRFFKTYEKLTPAEYREKYG